jgi:NADH dehydrogenase FAD-containing subunit
MGKHLVLAGCGHAHLSVSVDIPRFIAQGHRVTVISPSPFHYYSGMGPGLLGGVYRPEEVRFHIQKTVEDRGAGFVLGKVVRVEPEGRRLLVDSGETISYDVVSFNTGSYVPVEEPRGGQAPEIFTVKPIERLWEARKWIQQQCRENTFRLLVVGGGAASVEMAGNAWQAANQAGGRAEIKVLSGGALLSRFPSRARKLALESFRRRGILWQEGQFITDFTAGGVVSREGKRFPCDAVLWAVGIRPSPIFLSSGLETDEDGALLVNRHLQSVSFPTVFGGGDCIGFSPHPLDKVGVYAVRENPILNRNILAALEGRPLMTFKPQRHYQLIFNLGDGRAISCRRRLIWAGRAAFRLKDRIDRRFMRRFQVSGETEPLR